MSGREIGIVKWYDIGEGYGFVAGKQGKDIYVHYSAVACDNCNCSLKEGDPVEFTIVCGENGPQAQDVIILK
jgi:CspA family cold shock protein